MKQKLILACILLAMCLAGHAQKPCKTKCKLVHDKELDMDVYKEVDSSATVIDEHHFNDIVLSKEFSFKNISRKYPEGQTVKIAYLIGTDGKATFVKVLFPTGDPEIDKEAKRLIDLIPLHKPCKCSNEPVPCDGRITMPLIPKRKD